MEAGEYQGQILLTSCCDTLVQLAKEETTEPVTLRKAADVVSCLGTAGNLDRSARNSNRLFLPDVTRTKADIGPRQLGSGLYSGWAKPVFRQRLQSMASRRGAEPGTELSWALGHLAFGYNVWDVLRAEHPVGSGKRRAATTSAGYHHPAKRFADQPAQFDVPEAEEAAEETAILQEPMDGVSLSNKVLWHLVNVDQGSFAIIASDKWAVMCLPKIQFLNGGASLHALHPYSPLRDPA